METLHRFGIRSDATLAVIPNHWQRQRLSIFRYFVSSSGWSARLGCPGREVRSKQFRRIAPSSLCSSRTVRLRPSSLPTQVRPWRFVTTITGWNISADQAPQAQIYDKEEGPFWWSRENFFRFLGNATPFWSSK